MKKRPIGLSLSITPKEEPEVKSGRSPSAKLIELPPLPLNLEYSLEFVENPISEYGQKGGSWRKVFIGAGNFGSVYAGSYNGEAVAIKISTIQPKDIIKINRQITIFRTLQSSRKSVTQLIKPILYGYGSSQEHPEFIEVYPMCKRYTVPNELRLIHKDLIHLVQIFRDLHELNIAHLDFKIENLMRLSKYEKGFPILIDYGEAQFFPIGTNLTTSLNTSLTIFINSKVIKQFLHLDPISFVSPEGFFASVVTATSVAAFSYIDQILFGIFLSEEFAHHMFHTQNFTTRTRDDYNAIARRIDLIGKKLIYAALIQLLKPGGDWSSYINISKLRPWPMQDRQFMVNENYSFDDAYFDVTLLFTASHFPKYP